MNTDIKKDIVYSLLSNVKENKITYSQKRILYDFVINLENKTLLQKERFILYYNLDSTDLKKHTFSELSKKYGCSAEAVKLSHDTIRRALIDLPDEQIEILKSFLEE